MAISGSRTFDSGGERLTITVARDEDEDLWTYLVDSATRGYLDRGTLRDADPWPQLLRWFPEMAGAEGDDR